MKKGILLVATITIATIVGLNKIDALSLDGSYGGLVQVNDNDQSLNLYKNQYESGISFKYPYTANQGYEYLVFGYSGGFGVEQTNDPETVNYNYFVERFGLTITLTASNGGGYNTSCEIQNNMIVCPIKPNGRYNGIYAVLYNGATFTDSSPEIRISISAYPTLYNVDGTQEIINSQNQNTQEIINQNATYDDQPKEETEGKNETANYEQKEQALMGSLDFNMTAMDNISINPNASAFVWQIADRLRNINPAIILLMTSILGMGLIKLILNR